MGGRGREGGREGGGFAAWGIKVGGTGNSLRRTGTGVLRECLRDMGRRERRGEACMRVWPPSESKKSILKETDREQKRRHRRS